MSPLKLLIDTCIQVSAYLISSFSLMRLYKPILVYSILSATIQITQFFLKDIRVLRVFSHDTDGFLPTIQYVLLFFQSTSLTFRTHQTPNIGLQYSLGGAVNSQITDESQALLKKYIESNVHANKDHS